MPSNFFHEDRSIIGLIESSFLELSNGGFCTLMGINDAISDNDKQKSLRILQLAPHVVISLFILWVWLTFFKWTCFSSMYSFEQVWTRTSRVKMKLAYIQLNDWLLPSILGNSIYNNLLFQCTDSLTPLIPLFQASWGKWDQIGHSGGYGYLWSVQLFLQQVTGSGEDDRK